MIKRLRDFARKDDAVIEVFSEILLTGIIVIAIATAAAFVLSSLDGPDNVRLDIDHWADGDSDTLYFRHSGGETVDVEDLEILVSINGSYEKLTSSQFNYDDDEWALGDVIEVNTSSQFNYDITDDTRVPTKLVHTASSLVIYDAYGSMGDSGADGDDGGDNGEQQSPTADFSYSPANPIPGETVDFTNQSSDPDGTIDEWSWDFGDGNTSTAQNPSHQYSSEGNYMVTLTVTDNDGNSDSISKDVDIIDWDTNIIDEGHGEITLNNNGNNGYITDGSFFEFEIGTGNQYISIDNDPYYFSNKDDVRFVVGGNQEEGSIYITNGQIQTFDLEIDLFVNDVKEKSGKVTDIDLWKVEYLDVDISYIVPSNGEWISLEKNSTEVYSSDSLEDNILIHITDINGPNSFLLNMNITNNWIDVNPASYIITSNN